MISNNKNFELIRQKYKYWRIRIFSGIYVGYFFYYFTRKSFTFAMPALMAELGFSISDLGFIGSVLSLSYGTSKFISGILSDRSNPRYFMSLGLIATGISNIFFGFSSTVLWFVIFWGINGWFQGWGWPPCARLLSTWYSQSERGRWWGLWNTAQSFGGAVIPFVVSVCVNFGGWRYGLYIPGILCIGAGIFLLSCLRDTPQSLGLPNIEIFRSDNPEKAEKEEEKSLSFQEILFIFVLKNKFIWMLSFAYFLVYIVKQAFNDYIALFFMKDKGYTMVAAYASIFWFEIGGIFGSLASGWISDTLFKGSRTPVNVYFSLLAVLGIVCLYFVPERIFFVDYFLMFAIGFFIFGPQMLIGIMAAEASHKKAAGTATGFTGCWAYLGAAVAGYPIAKIIEFFDWQGFFIILGGCGVLVMLILLPLWKVNKVKVIGV